MYMLIGSSYLTFNQNQKLQHRPNQHVYTSCKTSKVTLMAEIMGRFVEASCFPKVFAIQMYSTYTINIELKTALTSKVSMKHLQITHLERNMI